jgi:hypothetical protein
MIHGETLAAGASPVCTDCGIILKLQILHSFAGYYIGSECNCGPYSRESGYYKSEAQAKKAFELGGYERQ